MQTHNSLRQKHLDSVPRRSNFFGAWHFMRDRIIGYFVDAAGVPAFIRCFLVLGSARCFARHRDTKQPIVSTDE